MNLAVAAIGGYQRWVSPYKGFRCAHDVLYGQGGCSGFGKRAFARYPIRVAWSLLRLRLEACRMAAVAYGEEKRKKAEDCMGAACDGADIGGTIASCACDAGALDIGACA